nr:helix-turn-helix transcriptional regulator [uncultured Clostridium sp.]
MPDNNVGTLIRILRSEHGMTQKQLADELHISDKTVSKWERGKGLPDISLIPELSRLFGIDIQNLLNGDLTPNDITGGNMKQIKYYVCPTCNSITFSTGDAEVSCCKRKLSALKLQKAEEGEKLSVTVVEDDWFITSAHPMNKEFYISFLAFASGDRISVIKQYPEWDFNVRIPRLGHGMLIWYSTKKKLLYQLL